MGLSRRDLRRVKLLYYKKGYSARKIGESFGVTQETIYRFMRKHNLSRRTHFESNRLRFEREKPSFVLRKNLTQRERELKTAGIMLYWAEGARPLEKHRTYIVDLANSNSEMIKLFLKFLRVICGVDEKRLRIFLYCYKDQNPEALQKYWSKITKVPLSQFTKPYIRKDFLPEKSGKMKYGLVHVRYADKKLLLQIYSWIEVYLRRNLN